MVVVEVGVINNDSSVPISCSARRPADTDLSPIWTKTLSEMPIATNSM